MSASKSEFASDHFISPFVPSVSVEFCDCSFGTVPLNSSQMRTAASTWDVRHWVAKALVERVRCGMQRVYLSSESLGEPYIGEKSYGATYQQTEFPDEKGDSITPQATPLAKDLHCQDSVLPSVGHVSHTITNEPSVVFCPHCADSRLSHLRSRRGRAYFRCQGCGEHWRKALFSCHESALLEHVVPRNH